MGFGQALSFAMLIILLVGGGIYWVVRMLKKDGDFKYDLKYKVFKKKYQEKDVERLLDYHTAGLTKEEVEKFLLVRGINPKKAKELCYIYKQIQLKGGNENGK